MEEKINASINLKENLAIIDNINSLYDEGQSNFKTRAYAHSVLSHEQMKTMMMGSEQPPENVEIIKPLYDFNGTIVPQEEPPKHDRHKRSSTLMPPECVNLPSYKNWVEEGKTSYVRDQLQCGKCQGIRNFSFSISLD
jgi:hypothetical protein